MLDHLEIEFAIKEAKSGPSKAPGRKRARRPEAKLCAGRKGLERAWNVGGFESEPEGSFISSGLSKHDARTSLEKRKKKKEKDYWCFFSFLFSSFF